VKKVDSSVKLVASGSLSENSGTGWDKTVVKESGEVFDYLSIHAYASPVDYASDKAAAEYSNLSQFPEKRLLPWLEKVRKEVDDSAPVGRKIGLSYDEWNVWHQWFIMPGNNKWEVGPIDAVFAAAHLNMLAEKGSELGIECACFFQPVNEGLIAVEPFSAKLTATGQVFALYRSHQGNRLLKIAGDLEGISSCASVGRDGKTIFVSLVNQKPELPQDFRIFLLNIPGGVTASARCLVGGDLKPNRPFREQPLAVKMEGDKIAGGLPKLSVAMIRVLLP
jgi:alpha-L-arabinofuranosidase